MGLSLYWLTLHPFPIDSNYAVLRFKPKGFAFDHLGVLHLQVCAILHSEQPLRHLARYAAGHTLSDTNVHNAVVKL